MEELYDWERKHQKPRTKLSVLLLLLHSEIVACEDFFRAKIFEGDYGLSKHLPVFLLGTEKVVGGGWMAILVVICGKICGKMCGKIEKLSDWNKNWCDSRYGPHDYDSGNDDDDDNDEKKF